MRAPRAGSCGLGVIDLAASPGDCRTHFSLMAVPGYRTVRVGQVVEMGWETPGQDGRTGRRAVSAGEFRSPGRCATLRSWHTTLWS